MTDFAFHPEAVLDLEEIWEYIAEDSLEAADRVAMEIVGSIQKMAALPHQGHYRPDLAGRSLRFLLVREYLVAYAPDERPVWIIAVMHGRRNPRIVAAILNERHMR